jgi:adenylosuccinate synthase
MAVTAVIGSQWGDEAKGKVVDLLSRNAKLVARFNGGDNAGHTVVNKYGTIKVRLTPNGFSNPASKCVIGPGVVVNLNTLIEEINTIQELGIILDQRLWISPRCHIVMPYHPILEEIFEEAKGKSKTGTTKRGMGPVYADKVSYNGIRIADLLDVNVFAKKLNVQLKLKNKIFSSFGKEPLDFDTVFAEKINQYKIIEPFILESYGLIQEMIANDEDILLEGAQGTLLDNNWGTYPFCTASTTFVGGAAEGLGIAPRQIDKVISVAKAYTTRVGSGPMPTELFDEMGKALLKEGNEFGTVTGRARRCGWFDADLVRFTSQINGATEVALTKLDVLDTLPELKICIGYRSPDNDDRIWHYWEGDAIWLGKCEPVYITMPGWVQSTRSIRDFSELPDRAKAYIYKIEELIQVPITIVSVGPDRLETIFRN